MSISIGSRNALLQQFSEHLEVVKVESFLRNKKQKIIKSKFRDLLRAAELAAEAYHLKAPSFRHLHLASDEALDLSKMKDAISRISKLYLDIQKKITSEKIHNTPALIAPSILLENPELPPLISYDQQIHNAVREGNLERIKELMDSGVDLSVKDNDGYTPLHIAAELDNREVLELLLAKELKEQRAHFIVKFVYKILRFLKLKSELNSSINTLSNGVRPLSPLSYALEKEKINAADLLLEAGAKVAKKDLFDAAGAGHLPTIKVLLKSGIDLNIKNQFGNTALHIASSGGNSAIAKVLLKLGADSSIKNHQGITAFHFAAFRGDTELVKEIYAVGNIDINDVDKTGDTALHFAALNGKIDTLNAILEMEGVNIDAIDQEGGTALHGASMIGHLDIVKALLKAKANIHIRKNMGNTALHMASLGGHLNVAKALIEAGAEVQSVGQDESNVLHLAACRGHTNLVEAFVNLGVDVNSKDMHHNTALHIAVKNKHEAVVKALIKAKADVDTRDNVYNTALHFALENNSLGIVKVLIEAGASIDASSLDHESAIHLAINQGHLAIVKELFKKDPDLCSKHSGLLHIAAERGYLSILKVLINSGANLDEGVNQGCKALHLAAKSGHIAVVRELLEAGDDVDAVDDFFNTPLHFAVDNEHFDIVKAFIKAGVDINALDNMGNTALHLAAKKGYLKILEELVKEEAELNAINKDGNTALHLAVEYGKTSVIKALLGAGANIDFNNSDCNTALHIAAYQGNLEATEVLLEGGAFIDVVDSINATPLYLASKKGKAKVVRALLKAKANINASDSADNTPFHKAVSKGHIDVVRILLKEKDININALNRFDKTALTIALEFGLLDIVDILLGVENIEIDEEPLSSIQKTRYEEIQFVWNLLKKRTFDTDKSKKSLLEVLSDKKYALDFLFNKYPELMLIDLEQTQGDLIINSTMTLPMESIEGVNIAEMPKADEGSSLEDLNLFKKYCLIESEEKALDNFIEVLSKQKEFIGFPKKAEDPSGFQKMHEKISNDAKLISIIAKELYVKVTEQTVLDFLKLRLEKQNLMKDRDKESEIYKEANQALITAEKTLPFYERAFIGLQDSFFEQIKYCGTRWQSGLPVVFTEQKSIAGLECFEKWKSITGITEDLLPADVIYKNIIYTYKFRKLEEVMRLVLPLNNEGAVDVHDESAYWRLVREVFHLSKDLGENDPLSQNRPKEELRFVREIFRDKVKVPELVNLIKERMDAEVKEKGVSHFSETKASECFTKLSKELSRGLKGDFDTANFIAKALGIKVNEDAQSMDEYYTLTKEGASKAHIAILLRNWGIAC